MNILHERLGPAFDKWHLNYQSTNEELPSDCRPVIHRLGVDDGAPHDHPWSFTTFILHGWYTEEVFTPIEGGWRKTRHTHRAGESRHVPGNTIHRVIETNEGGCFTCVLYGAPERDTRFYPEALA
jgi:hypothetical protein